VYVRFVIGVVVRGVALVFTESYRARGVALAVEGIFVSKWR
jgi:hypothetical protein